jgi:hypothetical protein
MATARHFILCLSTSIYLFIYIFCALLQLCVQSHEANEGYTQTQTTTTNTYTANKDHNCIQTSTASRTHHLLAKIRIKVQSWCFLDQLRSALSESWWGKARKDLRENHDKPQKRESLQISNYVCAKQKQSWNSKATACIVFVFCSA